MSDIAPESEKKVSDEVAQHFFDYVGRHLVCLAMQVITIKDGEPEDEEEFWAFSGFVMSFKGMWFFITAGHILKAVDDRLKDKTLTITGCRFADYFGMGTTVPLPTPFDYESAVKGYIDDDSIGLDIGLIYLSPLYREGFKKNGIIAILEQDWVHQHKVEFTKYYLLGFPTEIVKKDTPKAPRGQSITGNVRPVLLPVRKVTDHTELPDNVELPESVLDWFVGKILSARIADIDGMSGGPIIGLREEPGGGIRYWFVALQSAWYPGPRITLACPLPMFAEIIYRLIDENGITEGNIA